MRSRNIILTLLLSYSVGRAEFLTITDAYNLALQNSKNIKASEYQVEANKEQLTQAKAELYPQVYLSASYGEKEYDGRGMGKLSNYTLSLNQSVYDARKLNRIDITKSKIELDNFKVGLQKQELAREIFQIYMDILKSENRLKVYTAYINSKQKRVELLSKKLELSLGTKTDLLQGEVDYHFSQMDLRRERKSIRVNKLKLKHLTGVSSVELPTIDFNRITDEVVTQMRDVIESSRDKFSSNLKLLQSQKSLDLSLQQMKDAKSAHYPTVSINGQYSKINAEEEVSSLENTKSLTLQVQVPIYQGGKVESEITASKLSYSSARESLLEVEDEIKEEYEENFATFDSSSKSLALYQESLQSARAYLDSIQQSFNAGLKSSLDLREAESKLYEVKYRFVENIYDMIGAYINLLIVTNSFENLSLVDEIISYRNY